MKVRGQNPLYKQWGACWSFETDTAKWEHPFNPTITIVMAIWGRKELHGGFSLQNAGKENGEIEKMKKKKKKAYGQILKTLIVIQKNYTE